MMKSTTTTVVSKDSSLVVYIQQQIYRVFHIIRQHFFFQIFFALIFKHPVKQKKEYNSVFKSKEDAAVGANKTCAIELILIMTIYLV